MNEAIKEAKKALKHNDIPVGAVIVKNNKIIAKAHNKKELKKCSTKHAEIIAIEIACKKLKTWHLDDCDLYVTLEPCLMCCGAIIQSRLKNIYYGTTSNKFGYVKSIDNVFENKNNYKPEHIENLNVIGCSKLLVDFFKDKRK
ncbi:MAG: nucleoside deaminase [Bacilli bacterium]